MTTAENRSTSSAADGDAPTAAGKPAAAKGLEFAEKGFEFGILTYAYCCRRWPVYPMWGVGRCGYCGKRPKVPSDYRTH